CVAAFRAWQDPSQHGVLLPWMKRIQDSDSRTNWELFRSLAMVRRGAIPDFLAPPPTTPFPKLSEELARLRSSPANVVRAEIEIAYPDGLPKPLRVALASPRELLNNLADQVEDFWRRTLASEWGLLRSKLESEVLYRARALALGGLPELFKGMHRDLRYEN